MKRRSVLATTLIFIALTSGCADTKNASTFNFDAHAGIYISATSSDSPLGVIRITSKSTSAIIYGYTVATLDDAKAIAANGFPYIDKGGITTGTINGSLTFDSATATITYAIQITPKGQTKASTSTSATAVFDSDENLVVSAGTESTASTWTLCAEKQ